MNMTRSCGVLLHPTSLPGRYGIGDLGNEAVAFLDFLSAGRQGWWQMLPLGPIGAGFSPYQSPSSFAGNPLLISPDRLREAGWLDAADLAQVPKSSPSAVDPAAIEAFKGEILARAYRNFGKAGQASARYREFLAQESAWLDDYALFEALRESQPGKSWSAWPQRLAQRNQEALANAREVLEDRIGYHAFVQYAFHEQWNLLRQQAELRHIRLIGDVPIFVSYDSADVWANPQLFKLNGKYRPKVVAGVPPDYFNSDGQLWGNPVYDWDAHRDQSFAWWCQRLKSQLQRVDLIRLDHFRGFESYWEISALAKTARKGSWVPGPGAEFFEVIRDQLGSLPFIAEDLGEITPPVHALREQFGLPGMKVLQFAFGTGAGDHPYLPHNYTRDCVVYTGTHDNDTTVGWFEGARKQVQETFPGGPTESEFARLYLNSNSDPIDRAMIRAAYSSVAELAIIPMQDISGLGSSARMNVPGLATGNWVWRLTESQITDEAARELAELATMFGRTSPAQVQINATIEEPVNATRYSGAKSHCRIKP